jgi:hypothetical protein
MLPLKTFPARAVPRPRGARAAARVGAALPAALLASLLLLAPPASAGDDPLTFTTKLRAKDVTDFAVRQGTLGDRCVGWTKFDGHVVATFAPTKGTMTIVEPPGAVGPLLTHTLERPRITVTMKTTGTTHPPFPCGCGPDSELGPCPPQKPDVPLNTSCKKTDPSGLLSLVQQKEFRLVPLIGGPVESMLERCDLPEAELVPADIGFTETIRLEPSAIWALRKLKVGRSKTYTETVMHDGEEGCFVPADDLKNACGKQTFTITAKRTK